MKTLAIASVATALVIAGSIAQAARKGRALTHTEAISACVELRANRYECREPFVEALIEIEVEASGREPTPQKRARMREIGLREIVADGSAPLATREARCREVADKMTTRRLEIPADKTQALKACYVEKDCKKRVDCMLPLVRELASAVR